VRNKSVYKMIVAVLAGMGTVIITMLAFVPFFNEIFAVEVAKQPLPVVSQAPLPDKPEKVAVTVYYVMEETSKKISELYIEVFPVGSGNIYYLEVPVDSKVNLSEGLYKSLQTYGPELPQHVKLRNMAESFSAEYGFTACNRILSEVLGISFTEYVRTDADSFDKRLELLGKERNAPDFFEGYSSWLEQSVSSRTTEERWMYYESETKISNVLTEAVPGSREKDGYVISYKRSKERLEELVYGTAAAKEP